MAARGGARPAVDDREHQPRQTEEREQQRDRGTRGRHQPCPVSSAARTMRSSLKNGPNGGQAVTAKQRRPRTGAPTPA